MLVLLVTVFSWQLHFSRAMGFLFYVDLQYVLLPYSFKAELLNHTLKKILDQALNQVVITYF